MAELINRATLFFPLNAQAPLDSSESVALASIELDIDADSSILGLTRVNPEQTIPDSQGLPDPANVEWYVNGVFASSQDGSDSNVLFVLRVNDTAGGSFPDEGIAALDGFFSASWRSTGQVTGDGTSLDQLLRGQVVVPLEQVTQTQWYARLSRIFWPTDNSQTDPNTNPQLTHLVFTPAGLYAVGRLPTDFLPISIGTAPLVALYVPQNASSDKTIPDGAWVLDGFPFRVEGTDLPTAGSLVQTWGKDFLSFKRSSGESVRFLSDVDLPPEPARDTRIFIQRQQSPDGSPALVWQAERFRVDIVVGTPNSSESHFRPASLQGRLVWNAQAQKWQAAVDSANQPVLSTWAGGPSASGMTRISAITEIDTTATVITTSPHGLALGQRITISGVTGTTIGGYIGTFRITQILSNTSFTFTTVGGQTTGTGGIFTRVPNVVTLRMYGNVPPGPLPAPGSIRRDRDVVLEFDQDLVATDVPTVPSAGGNTSAWLCTDKGWVSFQGCTAGPETVPGFGEPAALNGAVEVENIYRDLIVKDPAVGLGTEAFALPASAVELSLLRGGASDPSPLAVVFRITDPVTFLSTPPFWLSPSSLAGGKESQAIPDLLERPVQPPGKSVPVTESDPPQDDFLKRFVSSSFMTSVTDASKTDVRLRARISLVNHDFVFAFASDFLTDVIVWTPPAGMPGVPLGVPLAQGAPLANPSYADHYFDANRGLLPYRVTPGDALPVSFPGSDDKTVVFPQPQIQTIPTTVAVDLFRGVPYFLTTLPGLEVDFSKNPADTHTHYRFAAPELDESFAVAGEKRPDDSAAPVPGSGDVRLTWVEGRQAVTIPALGGTADLTGLLPPTPASPNGAVSMRLDALTLQGRNPSFRFTFLDSGVAQSFVRDQTPTPPDNQRDENPATRRHVAEVTVGLAATVTSPASGAILPAFNVKTRAYDPSQPAVLRNGQPVLATADVFQGNERAVTLDGQGNIAAEPTPGSVWIGRLQSNTIVETETRTVSLAVAHPVSALGNETDLTLDLVAIPVSRKGNPVVTVDPLQERWCLHDGKGGWPRLLGFWIYPVKLWQFTDNGTELSADIDVILMRKRPRDARPPVDSTGIVRLRLTVTGGNGQVEVVAAENNTLSGFDFAFTPPPESEGKGIVRIAGTLPTKTINLTAPLTGNLTKLVLAYPAGDLTYDYAPNEGPSVQLEFGALTFTLPQRTDRNRTTAIQQTTIAPGTDKAQPKGFAFTLSWKDKARPWLLVWSAEADKSPTWTFLLTVASDANSMTVPLDSGEALGNRRVVFRPAGLVVESESVKKNSWWKRADSIFDGGFVAASFTPDGTEVALAGQLLAHLVDRNPPANQSAQAPTTLVATIDLDSNVPADVELSGVFAAPNFLNFVPDTGGGTYVHTLSVFVDQARLPSEVVFLGLFAASPQPFPGIVEHQLSLPDGSKRRWQVPQLLRLVAMPPAVAGDPPLIGFDAGSVLLLRAPIDGETQPTSQTPPAVERPGFMSLRLIPRNPGRFEPSGDNDILELRLPALLALKATGTPPSIKVPTRPITPTDPGSYRFITAGTQPANPPAGANDCASTVHFIRRDPLARYLRADVLAHAIGPASGQPSAKPTYREQSSLVFLPTILPEMAALGGLGKDVLNAGFVVAAPAVGGQSIQLVRPLVVEPAVAVALGTAPTATVPKQLNDSLGVDAQLGAFIGDGVVQVAHQRVTSDLIAWGQEQLSPLRTSDGGIVVSDFADVTALPAPPESGARDGVWGRQALAPDQPLIVGGDSRCAFPDADFARTVAAAFCGLVEFDAGPSPANDRGQCISGVRHRLAPTWEGRYWRIQPAEILTAGGAQFATALNAPQTAPQQAVRAFFPSTADFATLLTHLAAGAGSSAEAAILVHELNLLLQADGAFAVIQADSPPPHDFNARCRARREALSVLFGNTLPPPVGQRTFANRFRPARAVSGDANALAITHDEQTPFFEDPDETAEQKLPMLAGVMQRLGPDAPSDSIPSLLPPLIDVVAWSARPGETGTDRWSVHEYEFPATNGTPGRFGLSQQSVTTLRRPRARAGRDEKVDLQCLPSVPLFSNRFVYTKFNLKQTLGDSEVPVLDAQNPFAAINAVGVDRTHFQAAVSEVSLAPTFPAIFLYEGTQAHPVVRDVTVYLVANPFYIARSDQDVRVLLSGGTVSSPITVPLLRTLLCFNLGASIGALPIQGPFASAPTPEQVRDKLIPYVNPIADTNTLTELANPGANTPWSPVGSPAVAQQMVFPLAFGFDIQLTSWGDGSGVPTSETSLVIVGIDNNNLLHIRAFDFDGLQVLDTDETKLPPAQAPAILTLKQQISSLLPPHIMSNAEKSPILSEVTSIVGQTLATDNAPAAKIYTNGIPSTFALGVLTFKLDVGPVGANGAVSPPSQWKWKWAGADQSTPAQTELFINFVNKQGSIIPPKMSAALLAWPGQLAGQPNRNESLFLAGYRLMDDRDFSPIEPFAGDTPNHVVWVRQSALESLLRSPREIRGNSNDQIFQFDIVITGSSGELIPTNSIS